ncbi:hypothetical protein BU16DRAFT_320340 [Lophium mytilinum]|uniref:Azaphilone pigments biosynthesis cluster protein L N-terminal domain-containing protein n=1 Tax=Lophium mytilinum TaxID=390894 RepID=A0A6A6QZE3_9PEZI|nr:hypothetical protein BU16DRAFT_320340 [Lophium mytilinum]
MKSLTPVLYRILAKLSMAGIGEALAIIGTADVGLKGINALYQYIKDLQDVPQQVGDIRTELERLEPCLRSLSVLKSADEATQKDLNDIGLAKALNDCDAACKSLVSNFEQ